MNTKITLALVGILAVCATAAVLAFAIGQGDPAPQLQTGHSFGTEPPVAPDWMRKDGSWNR